MNSALTACQQSNSSLSNLPLLEQKSSLSLLSSSLLRSTQEDGALKIICCSMMVSIALYASSAAAGSAEQAKRIHDRLAGVPPTEAVLTQMQAEIDGGNLQGAAEIAVEQPTFYSVTLQNFAAPWTNEAQTAFVDLNDYSATVIGMVRDDVDFRQILSGNIIYIGDSGTGAPAYSNTNNAHYEYLDSNGVDLQARLVQRTQTEVTGLAADATAGVITTRAAAKAFFKDGTNRAMFRFTLINHMCLDLEQVKDITLPSGRIRQDVSRSPGGDSRIYLNNCIGCHTGMDPLSQAYAYYEYSYEGDADPDGDAGFLLYNDAGELDPITGTRVTAKHHINENTFSYGYQIPDDQWINAWRTGQNRSLGWSGALPGRGSGAKSMGEELANSDQFAQCQVEKVFEAVCLRPPQDAADRARVDTMVTSFKGDYRLKQVFVDSAIYCRGE